MMNKDLIVNTHLIFPALRKTHPLPDIRSMQRRTMMMAGAAAAAAAPVPQMHAAEKLDSQRFREAALAGDLSQVTSFLDRDPALVYARDERGTSIFTLAALAGQAKVTEEFTRRGLKPDIFEAAALGDAKRITELADAIPAIVRTRAVDGRTPLHFAAAGGHNPAVIAIQSRGADLNAGPEPPLISAIDSPRLEAAADVAQTLLGNGANPRAQKADGKPALEIARERGNKYVIELLERKLNRDHYALRHSQNLKGEKPVPEDISALPVEFVNHFVGLAHTKLDEVKRLLKLCPSLIWARATFDEMGVEAGAHMGFLDMVDLLTNLGAPVSTCTATVMGMSDFVQRLIAKDRNCLRERGAHDFPLLWFTAFGKERVELADLLLKAGADPNAGVGGQNTLHIAAQKGYVELAKLLIDRGTDPRARSRRGMTPLDVAEKSSQPRVAEVLKGKM
jgi:ankyrin repeat protein